MEMEGTILKTSINNKITNATNILGISEDLRYLIQSNMKDQVYQIQRMLADELDVYSERGNQYVDNNIKEIQELYKDMEQKKESREGRVEDKEVILIKPYEVSVVATTRWNSTRDMLTSAKLSVGYLVVGITRELDKEPSLY